ncbi:MAG: hypothetical protein GF333_06835 [Candidatus Omnitrophica bacterium]|nr:hypothetical protein [Candidatus Omnitrophota bacterium]
MKMLKILIVGAIIGLWTSYSFANNSQFQVRLALEEKETQTMPHDLFPYTLPGGEEIQLAVAKDVVLSTQDVQEASIRLQEDLIKDMPDAVWTVDSDGLKVLRYTEQDKLNLTAEPRIEFKLTDEGARKFADFTKKNTRKSVAVIGDNRVLAKVMIMEPITSGKIQIFTPTDKVNEIAKLVERMGLKLEVRPSR